MKVFYITHLYQDAPLGDVGLFTLVALGPLRHPTCPETCDFSGRTTVTDTVTSITRTWKLGIDSLPLVGTRGSEKWFLQTAEGLFTIIIDLEQPEKRFVIFLQIVAM